MQTFLRSIAGISLTLLLAGLTLPLDSQAVQADGVDIEMVVAVKPAIPQKFPVQKTVSPDVMQLINWLTEREQNSGKSSDNQLVSSLIPLLERIKSSTDDSAYSYYLGMVILDLKQRKYGCDYWQHFGLSGPRAEILFLKANRDVPLQVLLTIPDWAGSLTLWNLRDLFERFQARLPESTMPVLNFKPDVPAIEVADLIATSYSMGQLILYPLRPGDSPPMELDQGTDYRLIINRNVMDAYVSCVLKPVARLTLAGIWSGRVDTESMMVNRVMKLLAHYLGPGPFQLGNWQDSQSLVKSLDENFYVMEEVKASLLSLLTFEVLVESGLYADRRLNWFAAYMALLMDGLRERNQAVHYRASLIQCNYFLQNGGLAYNMNDRNLIMNVSVFRKNLDDFVGLVVGGYSAPVNLISTYGQIKPELTQLYDKMEEIPRRIIYRWAGDWNKIEEIE